jgi:hypothetical protein
MGFGIDIGKIVGDFSRQTGDSAKRGASSHQQQTTNSEKKR